MAVFCMFKVQGSSGWTLTIVCEEGEEKWTEYAPLWSTGIENNGA